MLLACSEDPNGARRERERREREERGERERERRTSLVGMMFQYACGYALPDYLQPAEEEEESDWLELIELLLVWTTNEGEEDFFAF